MKGEMDEVFKALADPSRRMLLDSLNAQAGQTLTQLCGELSMARQSVSKHLAVLEGANLITTRRRGREKLHYVNAEPINAIADRWIRQYDRARIQILADLKTALEGEPMTETTEFVYTTYIKTTPERLWQALTDPAFSQRYLGHSIVTDWKVGSTYAWRDDDLDIRHPEQVVLEYQPYSRLAITFHTFVPEIGTVKGIDAQVIDKAAAEPRSTVTFEIEPAEDQVKLTVIHAGFPADSVVRGLISGGWPWKLSNLKSGLEAAEALV